VEFWTLLLICVVGSTLIASIIALTRSRRLAEKTQSLEKENGSLREQLRGITVRVYELEKTLEKISRAGPESSATEAGPATPSVTETPAVVTTSAKREQQIERPPAAPVSKPTPPATIPLTFPAATPRPSMPPPQDHQPNIMGKTLFEQNKTESRSWADLEERLGANWLNKIGTAAFVIGVALLLNYSMHYLGARGKIVLGYSLSSVLVATGVFGERTKRYRIAARAVLGGGWALAYFTTYALHNIAMVRLVNSPGLGFALLFAVAVAMVLHSLKYDSEITTGFAYLLAFATVAVSEIQMGGLVASALLAASLAVTLRARKWFAVEPLAIVATYTVHWMWLNQVYERVGGHKPFPEFAASVTLLSLYWAIYLVSYFLREEKGERETQLLTGSFLLNAAGYLVLLHYQSFHPEWRFYFLLAAGGVYFGVSAWSRYAGRRWGFVLASTLGAALMIAAIPYRYSGGRLEIFWLIETEALLIAGWRLLDKHLRALAWVGATVLGTYVAINDLGPRFDKWRPPDPKRGWLLLALATAYFIDGQLKSRLGKDSSEVDRLALPTVSVAATIFLLAAAWVTLPFFWTAVAWVVLGVALVEASRMVGDGILRYCGHGAVLLAVARLLVVNMARVDTWHNVSLRLITVSLCCAILYLASRRLLPVRAAGEVAAVPRDGNAGMVSGWLSGFGGIATVYTAAATLLIALLIWDEAATAAVGLAWGLFGLSLLETAELLREKPLLVQGRLLLLASFGRVFIADLNSTSRVGPLAAPVITVTVLATTYFYAAFSTQESPRVRATLLWFGTLSFVALARFELRVEWVAVGWAAMAVVLYGVARYLRETTFREQSYAMTLLAGIRCAFDNFYQLSPWHFTNVRTVTVVACALLFYLLFAVSKLRKQPANTMHAQKPAGNGLKGVVHVAWFWIETHEQHLFFFVPTILLTVLLSLEVRRGFLTAAWGVEGLVVFLAVLKMDERAYRWFSLLLFLLCAGRVVTVDVWNLDALGRIVSFLGLGSALLVVSFLYARHRELLRRVL
jgi:uncharacterized membrane protein